MATAGALHLFIGSLADWTTTLLPLLGREETISLIQEHYNRLIPAMYFSYAGMILLILTSAFAVLTRKTLWDFVLSQGSGNAALWIRMAANAV